MKYDVALYVSYTPTYIVPSTVSSIEASEASYREYRIADIPKFGTVPNVPDRYEKKLGPNP